MIGIITTWDIIFFQRMYNLVIWLYVDCVFACVGVVNAICVIRLLVAVQLTTLNPGKS